ncbi:MAG TPA: hypothetical protein VKW08_14715 [Xanthobacteraceae bacterium]|jgi:hypothetical protein|nr:hypothetical protein [Xanthobacteraceae bacterium]
MLEKLEGTELSSLIRDELWGWPLALTLHAFGTAIVIGFMIIISLRLFGFFATIPYATLGRLFPVIWAAIVLQILSGAALWMAKPTQYAADIAFLLKAALIVIGLVLTLYFQRTIRREAAGWETSGAAPSHAARFVAAALLVWCAVLVTGRLTAHLGSLSLG